MQLEDSASGSNDASYSTATTSSIQGVLVFVIPVLRSAEEMRISLRRLQNLLFGKKNREKTSY